MRIISLCPSLTELVCDLGRGDDLIARTKFCIHPAERVAAVESVGGTKNPKIERIVALQPDVVFLNEEENRVEDADALRAAGITCHVSFPRTTGETAAMVRSIGSVLERGTEAEQIACDIEGRAERVRARNAGRPPVRYVYLIWRRPWMTINDDTFIAALLALPGGSNVFGHLADRYPEIGVEEIGAAHPDVVLLSTEPFPFKDALADELAEETGMGRDSFRVVDGEYLSWHGSRTPEGIDYAERVIRG